MEDMSELAKMIFAFVWLTLGVAFIGMMSWQIQRQRTAWVVFDGLSAVVYILGAMWFMR